MNWFEQEQEEGSSLYKNILSTAKIAGVAAILSFLGSLMGVAVVVLKPTSVVMPTKEGFDDAAMQQMIKSSSYISGLMSLVIGVLAFYFLFRFALLAKRAVQWGDRVKLNMSIASLASYFKLWGVIMLFVMVLFVMSLLGGLFGG